MNLGKVIKVLRKERGLTQNDLSTMAGITQAALSQIESGSRPGTETINKIADVLKTSEVMMYVLSIERTDIPKLNVELYDQLYPALKSIISCMVTGKNNIAS